MFKKLFVMTLVLLAVIGQSYAQQTRAEIQQRQKDLQKELDDLNTSLSDVRKSKKISLRELNLIQQKINARQNLISNIKYQVSDLDKTITVYNKQIDSSKRQLDTLKNKYAQSIVFAYKNRNSYSYISFLFAASSFNEAFRRIAYLKSYRQYRESQAADITKMQATLKQNIARLESTKQQKSNALTLQGIQLSGLQTDKKEQDSTLISLKGEEGSLTQSIQENAAKRKRLQTLLQAVIRREIAQAEEEEKRKQAKAIADRKAKEERDRITAEQKEIEESRQGVTINNNNVSPKPVTTTSPVRKPETRTPTQTNNQPVVTPPATQPNVAVNKQRAEQTDNNPATSTPVSKPVTTTVNTVRENRSYNVLESSDASLEQSLDFEKNKGHLPWPVTGGYISESYGVQTIPGTTLKTKNDGVEISSNGGSGSVKSVASGVVTHVSGEDGYSVIIRHGKYFTTYSNLSSVNVNRGDNVNAGTVIGQMSSDGDGTTKSMYFMVTDSKGNPMNPSSWIGSH